ncbi:DUF4240 domain-containing protein [Actinomadura sp. LD22]|uniref:DUF4240 domain-containing protein n=1 Tax=Actinomadura physcomitrii TaxID=2650748 RepID=A0A6I4MBS3_9ACTN|nr:DUF4240 domain-containing protein [Actinomadura physcomitrii]MVZ99575.1 DUF4240 domain-containing protein [Actinomadura physcomitrii]
MDERAWWALIEDARAEAGEHADDRDSPDDPLIGLVAERLAELDGPGIVAFDAMLTRVLDSAYRRPLWYAAYLIEGGCGDDGFMDFRAGLALLGRKVFTRAVDDPDTLADVPTVVRMAREEKGWIGAEGLHYAARNAYKQVLGETESFDASMESALRAMKRPEHPVGDDWDVEDDEETRLHLPRLAALFL